MREKYVIGVDNREPDVKYRFKKQENDFPTHVLKLVNDHFMTHTDAVGQRKIIQI